MSLPRTPPDPTLLLSPPHCARRAHRPGEWTRLKAVTFIVTLAATRCVTLAATSAGMSRKSAYALKARDCAFSDAWHSALIASAPSRQGIEVDEVEDPPVRLSQGDTPRGAAPSTSSNRQRRNRRHDDAARDLFFARLAATHQPSLSPAADLLPSRKSLSL